MRLMQQDWLSLSQLLEQALDVPADARLAWIDTLGDSYESLKPTLRKLFAPQGASSADFLATLPKLDDATGEPPATMVAAGSVIGPYRLLRQLGEGGMGSVWLADRADGTLKRTIALKLPLLAIHNRTFAERFARERDILAALEHPRIARLYDAGVTAGGHPYLALEYVEGACLTDHCDAAGQDVATRVALFLQVLEAVQYAHSHLVVHRDLKPSNILVTRDGDARLLDFGIAKLLGETAGGQTQLTEVGGRALTPDYASPEQIAGAPTTTASDVYSLGVLLYELLTGRRPYRLRRDSRGALEEAILDADVRAPSSVCDDPAAAQRRAATPKQLRMLLNGDLDTIVLKALRKDPAQRYATAAAFSEDLERYRRGEPVQARPQSAGYRLHKFLGRNRLAAASATAVVLALTIGLASALKQADIANREARMERATKDFLIGVFKASDPRTASDKPRGSITAKELLDLGSARIDSQFAGDPDTRIQLLGLVADIYGELDENENFARLNARQLELAQARYGELHPVVINGLLKQADDANTRGDYAQSLKILDRVDGLIRRAGLEHAPERAYWWLSRGYALSDASTAKDRARAFEQAVELYAKVAPTDSRHAFALSALGGIYHGHGDYSRAADYTRRSIHVAEQAPDRDDGALSTNYANLGKSLSYQGDYDGAERAHEAAVRLARQTYGTNSWYYWVAAANQAQTVHMRGDRDRAQALFDALLPEVPGGPAARYRNAMEQNAAARVFEIYGSCLVIDGRPRVAISWLQSAQRGYAEAPTYAYDRHHVRGQLGLALDGAGDTDAARDMLKASLDGYLATFPPDSPAVLWQRQLWGTFLLKHGDASGADEQYREILAQGRGRNLASVALAEAGSALISLERRDARAALRSSEHAVAVFDHVIGLSDVRLGPYLWRVHAAALLQAGDAKGAVAWAQRALDALRRYDDPGSADIGLTADTLRAAQATAGS